MPQVPAEKSYFSFAGGLNTDASPLGYPDETTQDEENFEILIDGSRKRRRGLDAETGGNTKTLTNTMATAAVSSWHRWPNAGGSGTDLILVQIGSDLYFYNDSTTVSGTLITDRIDLLNRKVSTIADATVATGKISAAVLKDKIVVSSKYVNPFWITFDGTDFTTGNITIIERDFWGVDDGVPSNSFPTSLSNAHKYNLLNRGWLAANITQFNTDKSKYPSKNLWPWKGYRRTIVTNIAEEDGTWAFSSDKMDSELFGNVSAPQGKFLISPWDTESPINLDTIGASSVAITNIVKKAGSNDLITITAAGHTYVDTDVGRFDGVQFLFAYGIYGADNIYLDGDTFTISGVSGNNFDIEIPGTDGGSVLSVTSYGTTIETGAATAVNPSPFATDERPSVVASYAGRIFYLGIQDPAYEDKIYFSRIVEKAKELGYCYQAADPTDNQFNELTPADGGFLTVAGLNRVKSAVVFGDSLLIFSATGVWQLRGSNGVFQADGYSIRKISDVSVTSSYSVVETDDSVYFTGPEGIFKLFQDPQTGFLTTQNLTEQRIRNLWNSIAPNEQAKVKLTYDNGLKKMYILYQGASGYNTSEYDRCLVYDLRLDAFYKLAFPRAAANYIIDVMSTLSTENAENNGSVKFLVQTSTRTVLTICDMNQSDYVDFDGNEQIPYMVTGYDNLQDFQRFKQAPVIHVFSRRTETGFTTVGSDLVPVNASSILMRPIWDWSDDDQNSASKVVGHYGEQRQVYRHRRYYQPVDANDTFNTGFPVIVTRNKARGRGRTLHLRFDGEETYDAHILGWSLHYKATRKI